VNLMPRNWSEFQHYKDRSPPWIRLHRELLDNYDFHCLPVASRALAPMLWLLAAGSDNPKTGEFDATPEKLAFRLRMKVDEVTSAVKPLIDAGFFILAQGASSALADRLQHAVPETETETETEKKRIESVDSPPAKPKREQTGSRLPDDWQPDDQLVTWAKSERPDLNIATQAESFRDYWHGQPGQKGRKSDWPATFRNWIRNARRDKSVTPFTQNGGSRAAGRML